MIIAQRRASWCRLVVAPALMAALAGVIRADVLIWDADPAAPGAQDGAGACDLVFIPLD